MKKSYYLFNPGRMSRRDNTLKLIPYDEGGNELQPKYLPVEGVENLYCFGFLDANSSLFNFLGKNAISIHFFDYYEHYTGSFMPKDYLLAGKVQIEQTRIYLDPEKRLEIGRFFIDGAAFNMIKNLRYYNTRGKDMEQMIRLIEEWTEKIGRTKEIEELMGIEGNIRKIYYEAFSLMIRDFEMNGRQKQPPSNEVNALISFGNMLCYTVCLDQIYHTQLNPTISFLHQPGTRRYSLALDIAEIFKPILVDRVIFKVLNKNIIKEKDFLKETNKCVLNEKGRKIFIRSFEERLNETIKHRKLNRKVSYKHLVKLECYKLSKHILGMENYSPFKMWW